MGLAKNINNYLDVREILDQAVAGGGGRYTLPTRGKAVHWRQRAYAFKSLAQKAAAAQATVPGHTPSTPYDLLTFDLDDCIVTIRVREPEGRLETFNAAAPVKAIPEPTVPDDDPMLAIARGLIKDHKK